MAWPSPRDLADDSHEAQIGNGTQIVAREKLAQRFFDQFYRVRNADPTIPVEYQFAGANARIPPDVRSVLDVGCGSGEFLRWLPAFQLKVGFDLSHEALIRAGSWGVQGSVAALPFPAASFDLVTCFEVLEHLSHETFPLALQELQRVSRKYIILSVPHREVLSESLVWCPRCSCAFNPSWHVRAFDEGVLRTLFTEFRMVECRPCGPMAGYGTSRLASLVIQLVRRPAPPVAVCPQCGYAASLEGERNLPGSLNSGRTRLRGMFFNLARAVLLRSRRPYWLLAMYVCTSRHPGLHSEL